KNFATNKLISFLFKFSTSSTAVVTIGTMTSTTPLLKFASLLSVAAVVLLGPVCLYEWRIGKFKLSLRYTRKLTLYSIVMHQLLVPVIIGKLHVVGNGVSKTQTFLRVIFL